MLFTVTRSLQRMPTTQDLTATWFKNGEKYVDRQYAKKDMATAHNYGERCSTPYDVRELQIKMTITAHGATIKMAKIQKQ